MIGLDCRQVWERRAGRRVSVLGRSDRESRRRCRSLRPRPPPQAARTVLGREAAARPVSTFGLLQSGSRSRPSKSGEERPRPRTSVVGSTFGPTRASASGQLLVGVCVLSLLGAVGHQADCGAKGSDSLCDEVCFCSGLDSPGLWVCPF